MSWICDQLLGFYCSPQQNVGASPWNGHTGDLELAKGRRVSPHFGLQEDQWRLPHVASGFFAWLSPCWSWKEWAERNGLPYSSFSFNPSKSFLGLWHPSLTACLPSCLASRLCTPPSWSKSASSTTLGALSSSGLRRLEGLTLCRHVAMAWVVTRFKNLSSLDKF